MPRTDCPVIIPYWGGKVKLSKQLVPMIPPHDRYIEVFAGGLSMFFRKNKAESNIINDKDSDIINLYETVRNNFDEFKWNVKWLVKSRELFNKYKAIIKGNKVVNIPDPKRAAEYYYLIRNSFNNNFMQPMSKYQDWNRDLLSEIDYSKQFLDNVMIENLDYREMILKYPPSVDDFWYLDPPYVAATERHDYYFYSFTKKDHYDMLGILKEINDRGAKFMVSYDDRNEISDLLKEFEICKIKTKYSGRHFDPSKVYNELVITNYKPPNKQENLF